MGTLVLKLMQLAIDIGIRSVTNQGKLPSYIRDVISFL